MNTDKKGKGMFQQSSDGATLDHMGARLRAVRIARGLRVNAVAKEIGVSRTTYTDWEAGNVKNPDTAKLGKFAELAECTLDWLVKAEGPQPDLTLAPKTRRRRRSRGEAPPIESVNTGPRGQSDLPIAEIAASMSAHADKLNRSPQSLWVIPQQVLEISFETQPENAVIHRVVTRGGNGEPFGRGDYLLVDASRTKIDEPGCYLIADEDRESARRAFVIDQDGQLTLAGWTDDLNRDFPETRLEDLVSLGRVMGIFKPY